MIFDFGILTIPIVGALGLLGYSIYSGPEIVFEKVPVPHALEDQGYTSEVVTRHLTDAVRRIGEQAKSSLRSVDVDFGQTDRSMVAVSDYLHITPVIDAVRQMGGLVPYHFAGELVMQGNEVEFRLRAYPREGQIRDIKYRGPIDEVPRIIESVANDAMMVIDPYLVTLSVRRAEERAGSKDFPRTMEYIGKAFVAMQPGELHLLHNLWARTLLLQGKPEQAMRVIEQGIAARPNHGSLYVTKGLILAAQDKTEEAIATYDRGLELNPRMGDVYVALGKAYDRLGRTDEAVARLRRGIEMRPDDPANYHMLGTLLSKLGRQEEAVVAFRDALAHTSTEVRYFHEYGAALQAPTGF
ncbi:tetratricopeptide repeat protein [Azospirillum sp.]|uniref:tetratricopeptide repeat protein n=1 Tax=Azospirillum sp. TaxID=34012 RepID=UPI003D740FE2